MATYVIGKIGYLQAGFKRVSDTFIDAHHDDRWYWAYEKFNKRIVRGMTGKARRRAIRRGKKHKIDRFAPQL